MYKLILISLFFVSSLFGASFFNAGKYHVNLLSEFGNIRLKTEIVFQVSRDIDKEFLETMKPLIKDGVIRILGSHTLEELSTKKGKDRLLNEIKIEINSRIGGSIVKRVLFTSLLVEKISVDDIIKRIRQIENRCF